MINTFLRPLPGSIKAFVTKHDDVYTIVINENLSEEARIRAYWHEIRHIENGDLENGYSLDQIELENMDSFY